MYSTSDFKRGLKVLYQNEPYEIADFQHHKPGKGAAIVRTKLKNLITGLMIDPTFRSGDKLDRPDIQEREVQFLYMADEIYHFMDPLSYEQYAVAGSVLADARKFLVEGLASSLLFFDGRPISVQIPAHVVLEVMECDPAVRGDTVGGAMKSARLSTGFICQVPLFLNAGEKIKVDTRTGDYIERA